MMDAFSPVALKAVSADLYVANDPATSHIESL